MLLGAGTLAAANFATSDTVQAETEAVKASGIKSAETVQLGQSGSVIAALNSSVTSAGVAAADTADCSAGLQISPVGVGAWSWGDRTGYWGYGSEYQKDDNLEAYKAVVGSGISFIDTSEVRVTSACHPFSTACLWAMSASLHVSITPCQHGNCQVGTVKCNVVVRF